MSKDKLKVEVHTTHVRPGVLEVQTRTLYRGVVQKVSTTMLNTQEKALAAALAALGWTPPQSERVPSGADLAAIDRELVEIAGSQPQSPMLSWQGDGRVLIGGILDAQQLAALAALASRFGGSK